MRQFIKSLLSYGHRDKLFKFTDMVSVFCAYVMTLWVRWKFESDFWVEYHAGMSMGQVLRHIFFRSELPPQGMGSYRFEYADHAFLYMIPMMMILFTLYSFLGLYRRRRILRRKLVFPRVILANACLFSLQVIALYLVRDQYHPRSVFILFCVFNVLFCMAFRWGYNFFIEQIRYRYPALRVSTIIIGDSEEAQSVEQMIATRFNNGLCVSCHVHPRRDAQGNLTPETLHEVEKAIRDCKPGLVILAEKDIPVLSTMRILEMTGKRNIATKVLSESLAILQIKAGEELETVHGIPLVHFDGGANTEKDIRLRIILSRMLAALALLGLSPVFLVLAILIKLSDKGPVFFAQERYGIHLKPFKMYKFRTMRVGAEAMQKELETQNESKGGLFKIHDDPRVTSIGKFLRKYSLDELPQIYNVLKGDMRVVGPRPLPKRDIEHYSQEWHFYRHEGYPGLTCLWQVSGRSEIDFDNMCVLDIYYLRNADWTMDLRIVLRTMGVMLIGRGAY